MEITATKSQASPLNTLPEVNSRIRFCLRTMEIAT